MLFTPQAITDLSKGFSLLFDKGYASDKIPIYWQDKAERVDTPGTEINLYGWLAEMPRFRKWVGARLAKRLLSRSYQVKNEKYEFSYSIGRDDIKYDRFGIYQGHATRAGIAARLLWDDIITATQLAGNTVKCYDGQFFYDTDHPRIPEDAASDTFPNLFTGRDLTADNVAFVYDAMAALKDANGEPMMMAPNVLEYGPALRAKAALALNAETLATAIRNLAGTEVVAGAGQSNVVIKGLLVPVLNERLPAGVWFMHHNRILKPFVLQVEQDPTGLEARINVEDPHVWDNDEFLFGSRAYGGAGYTLPHLSARVEVA
jgi:phage major head subunit gpT-like protein